MSDKLRVLQEARNNNQKDGMEYRKEYEELAAQYDKLLADLRGKELAIVVVDNQRDELQNLVD